MLNDILTLDQQYLTNRSDFPPISWPWYRAWPSTNYEWFPWSICNGYGMPAGNAYPSGQLVLFLLFGTCLCSNDPNFSAKWIPKLKESPTSTNNFLRKKSCKNSSKGTNVELHLYYVDADSYTKFLSQYLRRWKIFFSKVQDKKPHIQKSITL